MALSTQQVRGEAAAGKRAQRLRPAASVKPWGRRDLGPWGGAIGAARPGELIGEIHHHLPDDPDPELFVKALFTGERLSIQVHPDAAAARRLGFARGKDEAWVVLEAERDATIGLGLKSACDAQTLRRAALDGSIVDLMIWHPCRAGDVFFAPAGSIHAIGGGVKLFEVQQNLDMTFRLHDYGRPRDLHLDEALAVLDCSAWQGSVQPRMLDGGRELLVAGPGFVMERLRGRGGVLAPAPGRPVWVAVIAGDVCFDTQPAGVGDVWQLTTSTVIAGEAELLLAYAGAEPAAELWVPA
jgi:mannose-6-phosphate isomerase